jgi:hypothetical protein
MPLNKKGKKIMEKMKEEYGKKKGESVFYAMENSGKLKGVKKAKQGMMANLKPVPAEKKNSLGKLPQKVRNKMGYAKYGKMMKARYGTMAKQNTGTALQKEKVRQEQRDIIISNLAKEYSGAAISENELQNIKKLAPKASDTVMTMQAKRSALKMLQKKSMGGSMKKGYGQARTSGMGLEDESLVPGKGYEYIKDLL